MKYRLLSKSEWAFIKIQRAQKLTGYVIHESKGLHYFWPMGQQPGEDTLALIGRKGVMSAAAAFLEHYLPADKPSITDFTRPTPKGDRK